MAHLKIFYFKRGFSCHQVRNTPFVGTSLQKVLHSFTAIIGVKGGKPFSPTYMGKLLTRRPKEWDCKHSP